MKIPFLVAVLGCAACWGQAPTDCKPNPLNIPEAKYPCIFPDGRAMFRVNAPNAQSVRVSLGGLNLTKGPDDIWSGTTAQPLVEGFHYYNLVIDGANVADPSTHTYFGSGWQNSGIEIPAPDQDFYQPKQVPRGRVSEQWYFSTVTGKWRRCFVYTPPSYDGAKTKFPVLYLLHGWGEDETGWYTQGHVDYIMDNLIAEKKAKPMVIVMDNLNAVKPGESAATFAARGLVPDPSDHPAAPAGRGGFGGGARGAAGAGAPGAPPAGVAAGARGAAGAGAAGRGAAGGRGMMGNSAFTDMMLTDLIPMIEKTYRVLPGRDNRAMAGLSMGGMQTHNTTMANLDKFAYIGLLSGGNIPMTEVKDPAAFKKEMKLVFVSNGGAEPMGAGNKTAVDDMKKAGINAVFYESPKTAHEWLTWRRSLHEFAQLLFK
ncbi:MAG TPA: alpha/beta hydrolase-fold protein [Bryobacteraceae bacterium]|nr:alpha/beta hydrolase-fold protein [Bryobacteraceae bacterium]